MNTASITPFLVQQPIYEDEEESASESLPLSNIRKEASRALLMMASTELVGPPSDLDLQYAEKFRTHQSRIEKYEATQKPFKGIVASINERLDYPGEPCLVPFSEGMDYEGDGNDIRKALVATKFLALPIKAAAAPLTPVIDNFVTGMSEILELTPWKEDVRSTIKWAANLIPASTLPETLEEKYGIPQSQTKEGIDDTVELLLNGLALGVAKVGAKAVSKIRALQVPPRSTLYSAELYPVPPSVFEQTFSANPKLVAAIQDERPFLQAMIHVSRQDYPTIPLTNPPHGNILNAIALDSKIETEWLSQTFKVKSLTIRNPDHTTYTLIEKTGYMEEILNELKANTKFQGLRTEHVLFPKILSANSDSLIMTKQPGLTLDEWLQRAATTNDSNRLEALQDALLAVYHAGKGFGELHMKASGKYPLKQKVVDRLCERFIWTYESAVKKSISNHLTIPQTRQDIQNIIERFRKTEHFPGFDHIDGHCGNILFDKTEGISFIDLDLSVRGMNRYGMPHIHSTETFIKNCFYFKQSILELDIPIGDSLKLIHSFEKGYNSFFTFLDESISSEFFHLFCRYQSIADEYDMLVPSTAKIREFLKYEVEQLSKKPSSGKLFLEEHEIALDSSLNK